MLSEEGTPESEDWQCSKQPPRTREPLKVFTLAQFGRGFSGLAGLHVLEGVELHPWGAFGHAELLANHLPQVGATTQHRLKASKPQSSPLGMLVKPLQYQLFIATQVEPPKRVAVCPFLPWPLEVWEGDAGSATETCQSIIRTLCTWVSQNYGHLWVLGFLLASL